MDWFSFIKKYGSEKEKMHIQQYNIVQTHIFKLCQHTAFFFYYTVNTGFTHLPWQLAQQNKWFHFAQEINIPLPQVLIHTQNFTVTTETDA